MLSILFALIAAAILFAVIHAATRPGTFHVARSVRIAAPPERIFPMINDFKALNTWLPFLTPDPNVELGYSGAESGLGAINTFSGNSHVGAGRVEITQSEPPSKVAMRLQMTRPMACDNAVVFTLAPAGTVTIVTWSMSGERSLPARLLCLFFDPDKMCGNQFEKGLSDLKALAEK